MQMIREWIRDHKPVIVSVAFSLFVFVIGWCAMLVFWISYGRPEERGFTFFVSFLFGDPIFLPIIAGSLLAYIKLSNSQQGHRLPTLAQERCAWIAAVITALSGAFIQGSWLLSDQTELNWTIPTLHEFNGAGWWHAAFFVFFFATVGYLFVRFMVARFQNAFGEKATSDSGSLEGVFLQSWKRLARKPSTDNTPRRFAMYLIWFGASGYAYLRQHESLGSKGGDWRLLVMIPSIALIGVLMSSLLCGRRPTIDDGRLTLAGALSAYGIVEVAVGLLYGTMTAWEIQLAIAFALLATRLVPLCQTDRLKTITTEILVGLSALGVILIFLRTPIFTQALESALITSFLSLMALVFIANGHGLLKKAELCSKSLELTKRIAYLFAPGMLLATMLLGYVLVLEPNLLGLKETLLSAVLGAGVFIGMFLFNVYAKFAEEEKDSTAEEISKDAAYVRIILMAFGLLMVSILFVGQSNFDLSYTSTLGIILLLPLLVTCILLRVWHGHKPTQSDDDKSTNNSRHIRLKGVFLLIILAVSYILLLLSIYVLREPVYTSAWDALVLFPILGSLLFIVNGIVQNGRLLCGISLSDVRKDRTFSFALAIIALGCLVVFPMSILPSKQLGSSNFSIFSPTIGLLGLYLASCTLPRLAVRALGCLPEGPVVKNAGYAGVKQDTGNTFIMISVAGLFAIHLFEWLALQDITLVWLPIMITVVGSASGLVWFSLKNNSEHYRETDKDVFQKMRDNGIDPTDVQRALGKHLENQARLVMLSLLPYSVFCLFGIRLTARPDKPFKVVVYNDFLLRLPGLHKYTENEKYKRDFHLELLPLTHLEDRQRTD